MQYLYVKTNLWFSSTRLALCRYKKMVFINGMKSIAEIIEKLENGSSFRKFLFEDSEFDNMKNLLLLKDLSKCILYFVCIFLFPFIFLIIKQSCNFTVLIKCFPWY